MTQCDKWQGGRESLGRYFTWIVGKKLKVIYRECLQSVCVCVWKQGRIEVSGRRTNLCGAQGKQKFSVWPKKAGKDSYR